MTSIFFANTLVYFTKYALDMHEYQAIILFTGGIISFASIPFWWFVSNKLGKRLTWIISMTLSLLAFLLFFLYPIKTLEELLILVSFIGLGTGAGGILFWSMLPDTIEYGEVKTGVRSESSLYGFMTFAQKGSIAFAIIILGIVLDQIGFEPNVTQNQETISSMKAMMSLIPALGIFLGIVIIYFYPIDSKMHKELLSKLSSKSIND